MTFVLFIEAAAASLPTLAVCVWAGRLNHKSRQFAQDTAAQKAADDAALHEAKTQRFELEAKLEEMLADAEQWQRQQIALQEALDLAEELHSEHSATERSAAEELSEMRGEVANLADHLAGQVVAALSEAEEAVSKAIESFSRISADAEEAAAGAQAVVGGSDDGVAQVAERATTVMGGFIQGMLTTARQVSRASQQIQGLVAASQGLYKLLDEVEGVADQTALLSFNASLEAARAGQAGRGFAVVAGEVRKLSERSRQAAEQMRGLTAQITSSSGAVYSQLSISAESSLEESCLAQLEINRLLKLIQGGDEAAQEALSTLGEKSRQVSDDIGRIIVAFQFHDLLRQRLEHVADPLCTLRDTLRGNRDANGETLAYAVGQNEFTAYAIGAAPTLEIVRYSADDDDNITLF